MRRSLAALALCLWTSVATAWTPPEDPDPDLILNEARSDAKAGRLDVAAAKHRWYHDNVLGLLPSHSGVRLSFALAYWMALAKQHPPAMNDIRAARDRAMARLRAGGSRSTQAFHDLAAISWELGEPGVTRDAFALLAGRDPKDAKLALMTALPALVDTQAYALAGAHLDSATVLDRMTDLQQVLTDSARLPEAQRKPYERFQVESTDQRWALVVVTLVQTNRRGEAEIFARRARELVGPQASLPRIEAALRGTAPPPRRLGD